MRTESEVWREIGEGFEKFSVTKERPEGSGRFGLCNGVYTLMPYSRGYNGDDFWNQRKSMFDKIAAELLAISVSAAVLCSYNVSNAADRAMLAYLFSAETEGEENAK